MFAANQIRGLIKGQSVGVRKFPSSGVAETRWYDRGQQRYLEQIGVCGLFAPRFVS